MGLYLAAQLLRMYGDEKSPVFGNGPSETSCDQPMADSGLMEEIPKELIHAIGGL